jgi:TonB family protein
MTSSTENSEPRGAIVIEVFQAAPPAAAPTPALPPARRAARGPKLAAGGIALFIHVLAIAAIADMHTSSGGPAAEQPAALEVTLLAESPEAAAPPPEIAPIALEVELPPLDSVPIDGDFGMGGSIQPPRMDVAGSPDIAGYSGDIALPAGQIATVLMLLEVDARGRVTSALVVRSTGNDRVDAAAAAYARATRWVPGSIGGAAQAMQTSLTVIFGGTPSVTAAN